MSIPSTITRFLYVTDLHGDALAYRRLPELCREYGANIIINGGDQLPKGRDMLASQREFLRRDFCEFIDRCAADGIKYFGMFGNDDLQVHHGIWLDLVRSRPEVAFELTERWHQLPGGVWLRGVSMVPDYPFGLKDWCLRDSSDAAPVPTRGRAVVSSAEGFTTIEDVPGFFASRPTLLEHLNSIVDPAVAMKRAILVPHAPPAGMGLGTLWNGEDVGSKSVRTWIEQHQPMLTLSGHIHESPDAQEQHYGVLRHTARLGNTMCHQPGQLLPNALTYSVVAIDTCEHPGISIDWKRVSYR